MDPAEAVYEFVRTVPAGKVVTYGQVADLVERFSVSAGQVGGIMFAAPPDVPWQRVVGAGGHLPIGKRSPEMKQRQRSLLEQEGVQFLANDCVDMSNHQWLTSSNEVEDLFEQCQELESWKWGNEGESK